LINHKINSNQNNLKEGNSPNHFNNNNNIIIPYNNQNYILNNNNIHLKSNVNYRVISAKGRNHSDIVRKDYSYNIPHSDNSMMINNNVVTEINNVQPQDNFFIPPTQKANNRKILFDNCIRNVDSSKIIEFDNKINPIFIPKISINPIKNTNLITKEWKL